MSIALVSEAQSVQMSGLRAFITPTAVHFCSVLAIAALLNVPGQTPSSLGLCLGGSGLTGLCYSIGTIVQLYRNRSRYMPAAEAVLSGAADRRNISALACACNTLRHGGGIAAAVVHWYPQCLGHRRVVHSAAAAEIKRSTEAAPVIAGR